MKYLKFYENFMITEPEIANPKIQFSDKTIDDVLSPDFFTEIEKETFVDINGVIHIPYWKEY